MKHFAYRFDTAIAPLLRVLRVRADRDGVDVGDGALRATFGFLDFRTPLANIASTQTTGPYRWYRALGPRLSMADHGLTFGTTTAHGVCVQFVEPIPRVIGPWPHPGVTLTVADPSALIAAIDEARAAGAAG